MKTFNLFIYIFTAFLFCCVNPLIAQTAEPVLFTRTTFQSWIENQIKSIPTQQEFFQNGIFGWSKDGKLAYYVIAPAWGPYAECPLFIQILDLVTDEYLESGDLLTFDSESTPQLNLAEMEKFYLIIQKYQIYYAPAQIRQFPVKSKNGTITIQTKFFDTEVLSTFCPNCPGGDENDHQHQKTTQYKSKVHIELKNQKTGKSKVHDIELPEYIDFKISGYYQSPFEERITIVYSAFNYHYYALTDILLNQGGYIGSSLNLGFK